MVDPDIQRLDRLRLQVLSQVQRIDGWIQPTHDAKSEDSETLDTLALSVCVQRFVDACKALMREYESGCKSATAGAIMQWSLSELAEIELHLMHDPGTIKKRNIFSAGIAALGDGMTTASLGFGKIAKQKGDRMLGQILAVAAQKRMTRHSPTKRIHDMKNWLRSKGCLKQASTTPAPPPPPDATNRSLMSLLLDLSASYQDEDGNRRPAVPVDQQDQNSNIPSSFYKDFFPPGNKIVQRLDGLTLTNWRLDPEPKRHSKSLKMVGKKIGNSIRAEALISSLHRTARDEDKLEPAAWTASADDDARHESSALTWEVAESDTEGKCSKGEASSKSKKTQRLEPVRLYDYGHTESTFQRTMAVMPPNSRENGGGWTNEAHRWEIDKGVVGLATMRGGGCDKWPLDIQIPPICEDGLRSITHPQVLLEGQRFRVQLDKESVDNIFHRLSLVPEQDAAVPLRELVLPGDVLEPTNHASLSHQPHQADDHSRSDPRPTRARAPDSPSKNLGPSPVDEQAEKVLHQYAPAGVWGSEKSPISPLTPGERAIEILDGRRNETRLDYLGRQEPTGTMQELQARAKSVSALSPCIFVSPSVYQDLGRRASAPQLKLKRSGEKKCYALDKTLSLRCVKAGLNHARAVISFRTMVGRTLADLASNEAREGARNWVDATSSTQPSVFERRFQTEIRQSAERFHWPCDEREDLAAKRRLNRRLHWTHRAQCNRSVERRLMAEEQVDAWERQAIRLPASKHRVGPIDPGPRRPILSCIG